MPGALNRPAFPWLVARRASYAWMSARRRATGRSSSCAFIPFDESGNPVGGRFSRARRAGECVGCGLCRALPLINVKERSFWAARRRGGSGPGKGTRWRPACYRALRAKEQEAATQSGSGRGVLPDFLK